MKRTMLACCCLAFFAVAAIPGGAQVVDAKLRDGIAVMRALTAQGDFKSVRREGKKLLASYPDAPGSAEVRLLLGAADCSLGFYDEARGVLAPILARGEVSNDKREAALIVGEVHRSKGFYGEAAADALSVLSMDPDDSQRERARGMLREIADLLSQEERRDLAAHYASVAGIELVTGAPRSAPTAGDSARGRRMAEDTSRPKQSGRIQSPQGGVKTIPVTVKAKRPRGGVFRIGVLCPLAGRFAPLGESFVRGASVALKEARARGTRNVELDVGDTRGSPLVCRSTARRLIDEEGVDALLGEVLSSSTIAAAQVAQLSRTVLLSPVATEEGIGDIGDWVFQTAIGSELEITAIARMAGERLGLRRIAFMSSDDPRSRRMELLLQGEVEQHGGELCIAEFYAEGSTDFSENIERIRSAAPEALFIGSDTEDLILILPQLSFHELGVQLFGTSAWNSKRLIRMVAKDLEGAVFPADIDAQASERLFMIACAAVGGPVGEVNQVVIGGYNGARILIDALAKSKSGGEQLRDELARSLEKRRYSFLDLLAGGAIPFYTVRGERLTEFGTLGARR
jgi:branched-chain amino acid transport system substrate-binding protein